MLPILIQNLLARDGWILRGTEAVRKDRRIRFFNRPSPEIAAIARHDGQRFRHLAIVIASSHAEMERLRAPKLADKFPRALFASLEELQTGHPVELPPPAIASFTATVIANTPVGDTHYQLAFQAEELRHLRPPQFFMMDVRPVRAPLGLRAVCRGKWRDAVDRTPQPLLKRPFGICRDFHPHFPADYLKRLDLPTSLTPFLYLPAPDRFDMLYKVLPDALGTPLMTRLKRGDRVHMIGPLGQPFDVRRLRADGIEEVHLVGGGVGMAPLITLIEALRFHAFRVKVFLGIATVQSLRYRDELAATFGEKPRDAYVYVDDFLAAGVAPADIFVSCDVAPPRRIRRLPPENLFHGLVPEQYRRFLATACGKPMAITCGPNRMMEVMADICRDAGVPLKVLLEKRMGCGIGVCFSCVQKVRRPDGAEEFARVCKEGPLFDAKDILWNNHLSKPPSVACGCAPRC